MSMGNSYIARVFVFAFTYVAVVLLYVLCLCLHRTQNFFG